MSPIVEGGEWDRRTSGSSAKPRPRYDPVRPHRPRKKKGIADKVAGFLSKLTAPEKKHRVQERGYPYGTGGWKKGSVLDYARYKKIADKKIVKGKGRVTERV